MIASNSTNLPYCHLSRTLQPHERQRVRVAGLGAGETCHTVTLAGTIVGIGVVLDTGETATFDPCLVRDLPVRQTVPDVLPGNVVPMARRAHLVGRRT